MVNASLNWASIVGIVLAVCGGGLYFLRSFKPALARDYDVFFAAIGLLCGGILFFQGWRLDPILQFGQFLLAGTTVFFAYESVRLRGITTDQARRSSFFEDEDIPDVPRNSSRNDWDDEYDKFDQPIRASRRFQSRGTEDDYQMDRYRDRRPSRAIPESAESRRRSPSFNDDFDDVDLNKRSRFSEIKDSGSRRNNFGDRRDIRIQERRGTRPQANQNTSRRIKENPSTKLEPNIKQRTRSNLRSQTATNQVEDASFIQKNNDLKGSRDRSRSQDQMKTNLKSSRDRSRSQDQIKTNLKDQKGRYSVGSRKEKPRDNSSRFDD